eukprot:4588620-Amphidinium_carterae.1
MLKVHKCLVGDQVSPKVLPGSSLGKPVSCVVALPVSSLKRCSALRLQSMRSHFDKLEVEVSLPKGKPEVCTSLVLSLAFPQVPFSS